MNTLVYFCLFVNFYIRYGDSSGSSNHLSEMLMIKQDDKLNTIGMNTQDLVDMFKAQSDKLIKRSSDNVNTLQQTITQLMEQAIQNNRISYLIQQNTTSNFSRGINTMEWKLDTLNTTDEVNNELKKLFNKSDFKTELDQMNNITKRRFAEIQDTNSNIESLLDNITYNNIMIQANLTDISQLIDRLSKSHLSTCKTPWFMIDGECFFYSHTKVQWTDAVDACARMSNDNNTYLAEPFNFFFLAANYDSSWSSSGREERAWVGASGLKIEGWTWNSGREIDRDASIWSKDQPNHDSTNKACGYLLKGELADWYCDTKHYYVCQKKLQQG